MKKDNQHVLMLIFLDEMACTSLRLLLNLPTSVMERMALGLNWPSMLNLN